MRRELRAASKHGRAVRGKKGGEKMKKRLLSTIIALTMVLLILPMLPIISLAADTPTADDSVTFTVVDGTPGKAGGAEDASSAFDGDTSTKWCVQNFDDNGAYMILEASQVVSLKSYTFTTAGDTAAHADRNPKGWTIYGSNDYNKESGNGRWLKIKQITDGEMPTENKASKEFEVSSNSYKYFKIQIDSVVGTDETKLFQLGEISVSATPDRAGWKALTSSNTTPSVGFYYLTEDLTLSKNITISKQIVIDLNGYVLKYDASAGDDSVIVVTADRLAQLTILDSRPTIKHYFTVDANGLWKLSETETEHVVSGGIITGGTGHRGGLCHVSSKCGGGVFVALSSRGSSDPDDRFTLAGGNIVG